MLVQAGTLPKTSSGKLQRALCKERYLAEELQLV
jgi:fatty-acyl-CoA synthase